MFATTHPFFMLRALWFVKVTDKIHTKQLQKDDPDQYKLIEDSWYFFIMHYEIRRIELLKEEFLGQESYYYAIQQACEDQELAQDVFCCISRDIRKCSDAWQQTKETLIAFSTGATVFIDIKLICALDELVSMTCRWRDIARYILRPRTY